jgi:two-component system, cell cycle response regulator DivK
MGEKALVIDDNENNLTLERDLLEVAGFLVLTAENATDGIALAKKELPDVIIMDMRLPDMRGSEAAKILLRDASTRGIPIVFVAASVLAEGIEEIKTIPNAVFVSKPINTRTFAKEIRQVMKARAE